jgi:hypothetical protein
LHHQLILESNDLDIAGFSEPLKQHLQDFKVVFIPKHQLDKDIGKTVI